MSQVVYLLIQSPVLVHLCIKFFLFIFQLRIDFGELLACFLNASPGNDLLLLNSLPFSHECR